MTWSRTEPSDSRPRYVKGRFPHFYLSRDKNGALDEIPDGWEVIVKNGHLKLVRKN